MIWSLLRTRVCPRPPRRLMRLTGLLNPHIRTRSLVSLSPPPIFHDHPEFRWTAELQQAFDALKADKNISFNAVAGAGKTTSFIILMLAMRNEPGFGTLSTQYLAFNRAVSDEMSKVVQRYGLEDVVSVHTYHSAGGHYYATDCFNDQGLKNIVDSCAPLRKRVFSPGSHPILVIDEMQDMNPQLYNFTSKLLHDSKDEGESEPQLLCLGDPWQSIYQYQDADSRFLSHCNTLFKTTKDDSQPRLWEAIFSTVSQRLSIPNANFINKINEHIKSDLRVGANSDKIGDEFPKPVYTIYDVFKGKHAFNVLRERLPTMKGKPTEVLILAASLKAESSPAKKLMNLLALHGYSVFIGGIDALHRTRRVLRGKTQGLTFHQSKGVTATNVVIMGFDSSYQLYSGSDYPREGVHPSPMYVALTRATHRLFLFHHYRNQYLPFIDKDSLREYCELNEIVKWKPKQENAPLKPTQQEQKDPPSRKSKVSELLSHIPERIQTACFGKLKVEQLREPEAVHPLWPLRELKTGKQTYEEVVGISAMALTGFAELYSSGRLKMLDSLLKLADHPKTPDGELRYVWKHVQKCKYELEIMEQEVTLYRDLSSHDMIHIAVLHGARRSGYVNRALKIPNQNCDWLTPVFVRESMRWIEHHLPKADGPMWQEMITKNIEGVEISGEIDAIGKPGIYELKFARLNIDHVLQTVCYAALYGKTVGYLLDCQTGHHVEITERHPGAFAEVLRLLVKLKHESASVGQLSLLDDERFCEEAIAGFPNFITKCEIPSWLQPSRSYVKKSDSAKE